jgi:hypothetical protein
VDVDITHHQQGFDCWSLSFDDRETFHIDAFFALKDASELRLLGVFRVGH